VSDDAPKELGWLQGPPDPDRVRFYLDVGDNVEFTEEQKDALDRFMTSLIEEEVSGHQFGCPAYTPCNNYTTCSPKALCEAKPICNPQSCNIIRA
jgi:hypothetical protein